MLSVLLIATAAAAASPRADDAVAPNTVRPASPASVARPAQASQGPVRRVDADADAGPLRDGLETVDAGSEDVGALGASFRQPAHDARLPTAFQRVYRVPGDDGKMMRGNGALFAVFPASVYRRTPKGVVAVTPPGTVYHIGMPGELHLAPEAPSMRDLAPQQLDGRVRDQLDPHAMAIASRLDMRLDGRTRATADGAARPALREDPQDGARDGEREASQLIPSQPIPSQQDLSQRATPQRAPESASAGVYAHLGFGPARVTRP